MELAKRFRGKEDGQALIEYTFIVLLVALGFWLGVKDTSIAVSLKAGWSRAETCVSTPFSCAP